MQPQVIQITTTPGTPVQLSATKLKCAAFWLVNRSTQVISVGVAGMVRSSGAGVIVDVQVPTSGATPDSSIIKFNSQGDENSYDLETYYADSATAAVLNIIPFLM